MLIIYHLSNLVWNFECSRNHLRFPENLGSGRFGIADKMIKNLHKVDDWGEAEGYNYFYYLSLLLLLLYYYYHIIVLQFRTVYFQFCAFYLLPGLGLLYIYCRISFTLRNRYRPTKKTPEGGDVTPRISSSAAMRRKWKRSTASSEAFRRPEESSNTNGRPIGRHQTQQNDSQRHLHLALAAVVICYFVCLLPYNIVVLTAVLSPETLQVRCY